MRESLERLEVDGRVVRGEFRPDGVEREWCDDDVLRQLRRRSLAALRREVEPVDAEALARFLPAWQGIERPRSGLDGLAEVVGDPPGRADRRRRCSRPTCCRPACAATGPVDLDALSTAGELVWVGAGPLGATDGRVRLALPRPGRPAARPPTTAGSRSPSPLHVALREHLAARGASFWPELVRAAAEAGEAPTDEVRARRAVGSGVGGRGHQRLVRPAAGPRSPARPARAVVAVRPPPEPPDRLSRVGPPAGAGRWSLVAPLREPVPTPTEAAHARALQLLERYGVLTREAALGEGTEGGFAGVYPVLKALEEQGRVRRGLLRGRPRCRPVRAPRCDRPPAVGPIGGEADAEDEPHRPVVLAATDPAQPYGAAIPWPDSAGRPARAAGRPRGPRRRPPGRVPRAGRAQRGHLPGGRRPPRLGRLAASPW